jgi:CO dehydrogenase/acetyl-CoA synthase delta subunit
MSLLLTGAELLIMYHPQAVEIIKKTITEMYTSREKE